MIDKLKVNGFVVTTVEEVIVEKSNHIIELSLHWLKVSGFRGKLRIVAGEFGDKNEPLFEYDV